MSLAIHEFDSTHYFKIMSTHTTLDAAATERKARLAKLASLKRKQPGSDTTVTDSTVPQADSDHTEQLPTSETDVYLSGRNYDPATRGPKLGFESLPASNVDTVEAQASELAARAAEQAAKDEAEAEAGKGIDLFKLQPKKPNWDLKRELEQKMRAWNMETKTQNAIARLVRERIENAKREAVKDKGTLGKGDGEAEEVGLEGAELVEAMHQREKEEEESEKREREAEEDDIP